MEESIKLEKENPWNRASLFSRLNYLWIFKCTANIKNENCRIEDIHRCPDSFLSKTNGNRLQKRWTEELEKAKKFSRKPSLLRAVLKAYRKEIFTMGLLVFADSAVIQCAQPFVLSELLKLFIKENYTLNEMLIYSGVMLFLILSHSFLFHEMFNQSHLLSHRMRVATSSLVYSKIFTISQTAFNETSPGKILTLLSNDVDKFYFFVIYHYLWVVPLQIVIVVTMIWWYYGIEIIIGIIGSIFVIIPVQVYLSGRSGINFKMASEKTDKRMKMMNEIYCGIEVIKMFTWEKPFAENLLKARKEEIKFLSKSFYAKALIGSIKFFMERLGTFISILIYSYHGYPLMPDMVFSVCICYTVLRFSLTVMFPMALTFGGELLISLQRLQKFLLLENKVVTQFPGLSKGVLGEIRLQNIRARFCEDSILVCVPSVHIPPGTLCGVVGAVGAGKTSFLNLILEEMPLNSGNIIVNGNVSFSSQKPWLFASTIQKNILFDQEMDEFRYKEVIRVCGLDVDLEKLPEGDKTIVGARGVTLSGGQRARINLARAIYKKADIYLLDDVLSALDSRVGRFVFEECIKTFLGGKTRVFVTHQLQYLKDADFMFIFNKGTLDAQGTYDELLVGYPSMKNFIQTCEEPNTDANIDEKYGGRENLSAVSKNLEIPKTKISEAILEIKTQKKEGSERKKQKFLLLTYLKSSKKVIGFIILILSFFLGQFFFSAADYWLTLWSKHDMLRSEVAQGIHVERNVTNIHEVTDNFWNQTIFSGLVDKIKFGNIEYTILKQSNFRIIYCVIVFLIVFLTTVKTIILIYMCMAASRNLHENITEKFFGAPMRFFNINPFGYTINVFSRDMGIVDWQLPYHLMNAVGLVPFGIGSLCLISIISPYSLVFSLPLCLIVILLWKWFSRIFCIMKHLESKEKSPAFSHASSTIEGIITIRAAKCEKTLIRQFNDYQDVHTSAYFLAENCCEAFGTWVDLLIIIFTCCLMAMFIITNKYNYVSGSFIGLAIYQCSSLLGIFQFGMRSLSEVQDKLIGVEGILTYAESAGDEVDSEREEAKKLLNGWPSKGTISIQNLCSRYESERPVLQDLNLEISPSEKIGIAGRTGAGKSSIISVLFRLSTFDGNIYIDGVDTKTIGLRKLRENISIIPQEPKLFSATIRYNMDPFSKYTDVQIWRALEEVELKEMIPSLEFEVKQGGDNFSSGQKQLICLARAILKKNKIIILDEATANVDSRTDELIQKTIRRKFKECTVLTIAHRLDSIIDSDRIMVLEAGRIVEIDNPNVLLQNSDGRFYKMMMEANPKFTRSISHKPNI